MRLSGISHGTELSLYRGTSAFAEVVEAAPDVTEVQVGDLVHTGTPHQEETVLDAASSLAATYPLVRLPTAERLERALFVSLATVALQAVHDAEIKLGDAVSLGATHVLDPATDPPVGLQIRARNMGRGVDVAIEVSGLDRGLDEHPLNAVKVALTYREDASIAAACSP